MGRGNARRKLSLKESHISLVRYFFAFILLSLLNIQAYAGWVPGYTYKSKLVIAGSQICGAANHTNFPVLIQLSGNFLKPSPTGLISNSNGYDIIFTSSDGTTILNHEIDNYSSSAGSYSAWVQIPTLTPGADTDIYMYYGNSSVSTNPSNQNTWNSSFRTVYHFQNNIFTDATSNSINGTNNGTTNVTAKFGDGRNFDGVSNYIQTASNDLATANNFTISLWIKADATVPSHMIWEGNNAQNGWGDSAGGAQEMNVSTGTCCPSGSAQNNYLSFFLGDRDQQTSANVLSPETSFSNTTTWQYVVATMSSLNTSPSAQLFLNGTLVSTDAGVAGAFTARNTWDTNLRIGRPGVASRFFDGQLDEIRISNVVRSSDWICTEFNNQNNPNTFAALSNHAPDLANIEGASLAFSEADAATIITATTTASDWDNANVASATIKITTNYINGEDVLSFTNTASITGSWNASTGTLTLTGSDTYANYQLALRAIKYQDVITVNPSTSTRTVSFTINDGTDNSNTVTRNITVAQVNDAPDAVNDNVSTSLNVPYSGNVITNDTDEEGNTLTLNTTPVASPTYGSVTLNASGTFTYTPKINFVGTDSFTYQICDNGSPSGCDQAVVTITVNADPAPSGCSGTNPGGGTSTSGLYAEYYTGYFNDVQTYFNSNTPTLIRSTDGPFDYSNDFGGVSSPISGVNPQTFSARYRGSVYIATTGSYTFYLTSDDAAYMWIDQAALISPPVTANALINLSNQHSAVMNQATVYLAAGLHNILMHFGNNNGAAVLKLQYSGPGIASATVIPATAFCSTVQRTVAANDSYTTGLNVALNGTALTVNDYNMDGNPLVVNTTAVAAPTNGSVTLNADGTFTYTPNSNFVGSDSFTYQVCNTGSPSVCSQAVVFISVANRVPSFTKGADQNVNEDAGAQTISNWATSIDDGDPGISQTLTFNVSNNNNSLFSVQPSINATGTLTYTSAANVNGIATVTVTLSDNGSNTSPSVNITASQAFTITVNAVNDAPSFTKGADQSLSEDAGAQTVTGWATSFNDGDPELTQTFSFSVSNNNNALFSVQPSVNASGDLTYTPAANANGVATITVSIIDSGSGVAPNVNTSASQTFTITISAVNDVPSFTKGADQTVNEDAGAQTVTTWAASISDGDPELTQTLTFTVTNNNNALFSVQPSVNATGDLSYTSAANINGVATVTITLSDNGPGVAPNVNTSASQTFTITINAINDAPSFLKGVDQSVNEDASAQTVTSWATSLNDGDPELTQTLSFNVTNDNNSLFSVQPSISASGDLTYTPAANSNGVATVTVTISDNSSGVAPNVNTSASQTFTITIGAINDAPSFTKGADQTINEDAGAQSVTTWATSLNDGDPELTQTFTFNVTNNNNSLFSVQPSINASGDLTYTSTANANGSATVTVTISDNGSGVAPNVNTSASQTFTITINAINDAPSFTKGGDQTVNEDATAQTVTSWATSLNDGDPELTQTFTFNVSNNNNALFSAQPSINASGDLTYTPAANANGSATVTVTISDNGSGVAPNVNTSASQTFTITINAINDAPSFTKGADQAVDEDSGTQTITGWATALSDGDPELTQTLSFNVTNNNNALFSIPPSIDASGELTYRSSANANGTATVTVTINDNGSGVAPNVNTSASQTFIITINAVNDAPTFIKGSDQTINEDAGAQSVTNWATSISDGDPELTQTLSFTTSNSNNALFSVQPSVSSTGTLAYTPAANANGSATVTVTLNDNGSGVAPNVKSSVGQTFTITVSAVNDAPSFTKGADQTVNEDAGAQSVSSWATSINDGDPELTQTLSFSVSNNNNSLFSVQPSINTSGDLIYTSAVNANGVATVTVTINDNGSGVAPNVNTSTSQTFTITISAVNDIPSFTKGSDQTVDEDAGAQTVTNWATSLNDGDPELTQTFTFNVSNNNNVLFSAQPSVNASGDLTYTPATNANGSATVTVTISDSGSGVAPNVNTSASQTFTITVNAVNDLPSFAKGSDQTINEDAGAQTITTWATSLNDGDPELTQTLSFSVSNNNNSLFSTQPSINASGDLTYTPAVNSNGVATVTVTISDNGSGVAPNVNTSASQTFTITVNAVNDVPSFTKGSDQTINEDAGAQIITTWATSLNDGDPELTQTFTFNVSNNNNPLFSAQPSINSAGDLTYTPAANANGSATVTVSISDNGSGVAPNVNTSAAQTFTITVSAINDVPSFTKGADQTVDEDAGSQTASSWATSLNDGDPEITQTFTFNVSNNNNALFSTQPSINASGGLTYTPAANANGLATVTVTISDNGSGVAPNVNTSASQTFIITVSAVNDAPSFTKGSDQMSNEDAGAQTITTWATSLNDGDPELTQTFTFNVSNNNNTLFSTQPSINSSGDLTYTPTANANGSATVTVTISDSGSGVAPNINTSASQTFTITVNAVNDMPSFTKGSDQTIDEDAGAQNVSGWGTSLNDGDPELTQTLSFGVSNNNNSLFSTQPSINASGDLTYTPAANANGTATVTVNISDNGSGVAPNVNTSASQIFTITVNALNDAPSFTKGSDQTINEDAGPQTVSGWATSLNDGDPELTQTITFNVSNNNNSLFSMQPSINASGDLTYTPKANANGSATVTVTNSDNGSGVAPNVNTGASQTFTITVNAVNDVPYFTKGSDQTVNEDAGPQTITTWATSLNDGDPELTQTLSFNVSNNNNALFSTQPAVNSNGDLTYTTASNANGSATITVTISDNGSGVAPNVNTSASQTFAITISPVNDAPTTVADVYSVSEGGTLNVSNASGVLLNDTDAEGDALQAVLETVTTNGTLTLNADGSFTYVHNGGETISDSFTYHATDGSASGNAVMVSISITPVNDAPVANNDDTITPKNTAVDITVISNDADADDGIDAATVVIISNPAHGTVSVNSTTGVITFTPTTDYLGNDSFTYAVSDNSSAQSNTATVNISVTPGNNAPVAVDDAIQHHSVLPVTIDVLANDSDPDNDALIIASVSIPTVGSATIENNKIVFLPAGTESATITFTYTIQDPDGLTAEATVTIEYTYDPFKISEGFSPNNDNNNDTWYIRNIEAHPNNVIKVFDRWGIVVYQTKGYDNTSIVWDGRANTGMQSGSLLESGTYYYTINLGDSKEALTGYIEIVR
jgi:gliding motility-associated-like protein